MTAHGLRSVHSCTMKWQLCDATLDAVIGTCPMHSGVGAIGGGFADQVCGAFIVSDPLSVEPAIGFDFAFGDSSKPLASHSRQDSEQSNVRIEVDVSSHYTVVYEGVANIVEHSTMGTSLDKILCDRGLCLRSTNSSRCVHLILIVSKRRY